MIKVGDKIKSLDFPGHENSYMIGEVLKIEGTQLSCETIEIVFAGVKHEVKHQKFFTTHIEGSHFLDEYYPGRITLIA